MGSGEPNPYGRPRVSNIRGFKKVAEKSENKNRKYLCLFRKLNFMELLKAAMEVYTSLRDSGLNPQSIQLLIDISSFGPLEKAVISNLNDRAAIEQKFHSPTGGSLWPYGFSGLVPYKLKENYF